MSYTQLIYHIVLRTHNSARTITEEYERELYAYLYTVSVDKGVTVYRIGGMPDHVHLVVGLPPMLMLPRYVQHIKSVSSRWLSQNPHFPHFERWTREYGAFTCSYKDRERVIEYVRNQKEHHKTVPFEEEVRRLFEDNGLADKVQYMMED